jgi:putative addiction module antidote
MRFKLRAVGNSVGIILPTLLLRRHNLNVGDDLIASDSDDSIILTRAKPRKKYNLRDLVAQSKSQDLTEEDKTWFALKDIGEEVVW